MREVTTKWLVRLGSFGFAGLLLFFALKDVDLDLVWAALKTANYGWMVPLVIITLGSHWLRAVRWKMFPEVLPDRQHKNRPISTWNTFISIMIGYMANYAGPRLGEVIRTGNVAQREKIPFSSVLGTVFVERLLDMVFFGVALLSIPFVFPSQTSDLWHLLTSPTLNLIQDADLLWIIVGLVVILGCAGIVGFLLLKAARNPASRLMKFVRQFKSGLLSLLNTGKPGKIWALTLLMWACYGLMAYLPFVLLGQNEAFNIGLIGAWGIMLIGALGVIVPSPGGIGTFHFVTIQSLGMLFAMPETEAATYALLAHSGQMLLYLLVGAIGILYLGSNLSSVSKNPSSGTSGHA